MADATPKPAKEAWKYAGTFTPERLQYMRGSGRLGTPENHRIVNPQMDGRTLQELLDYDMVGVEVRVPQRSTSKAQQPAAPAPGWQNN